MEKPVTMEWRGRRWAFLAQLAVMLQEETRVATSNAEEAEEAEAEELLAWLEVLRAFNLQVEAAVRPMLEAARAQRLAASRSGAGRPATLARARPKRPGKAAPK